ncbi:ParB/Srx family N-terminal domain-containing protein [Myroides marinus]|uniref:ParB/Srx family N-terminal domain-containing protein n=1 Tax=Myroides marinus TaxID=703342 RepID=UPI002574A7E2|nr:ParB/Srx family N-terminal domain-containing protein [Myroides marinus]MDM1361996.1 hypothetical protein [Myroides marinus]
MKYYWKDILDQDQQWKALELTVEGLTAPTMQLLSGSNWKMKLVCEDKPVMWGLISRDFCDIGLVRTFEEDSRLIKNINSEEVEKRKGLSTEERLKSWSRYFAEEMVQADKHFFYDSIWLFEGYKDFASPPNYGTTIAAEDDFDPFTYACWDRELLYSRKVDEYSGRLKWWRKKAIEGSLPPVFAWYIPSLGGYWIIDGNYRLRAAILEKKDIPVVLAYSGEYKEAIMNPDYQRGILHSLEKASLSKTPPSEQTQESMNRHLMQAFDDRPYFQQKTVARVKIKSNEEWLSEVTEYLTVISYSEKEKYIQCLENEL